MYEEGDGEGGREIGQGVDIQRIHAVIWAWGGGRESGIPLTRQRCGRERAV